MPDAHDYRAAAVRLRRLGSQLVDDSVVVHAATDAARIVGGPIGTSIDRSRDAVVSDVENARAELDRLAGICDRRAEICARFTDDLVRHRHLAETVGRWVPAPVPPAWWVEP